MSRLLLALLLLAAAPACSNEWDSIPQPTPGPGPGPTDLVGIGITPLAPKVTAGETLQFTATGFYADRRTVDLTDTVDWLSSAEGVVTVSGALDQEGLGTAVAEGVASVTAAMDGLESNAARVTVTAATVEELVLTPAHVSIHEGGSTQLNAAAVFSDGTRGNVSGSVRWITADFAVATVDTSGRVSGESIGRVEIRAVYEQGAGSVEAAPAVIDVLDPSEYIGSPDLRGVGLSATGSGQNATFKVEVRNSGDAPASGFWVDVWANRTAAPPTPPTQGDGRALVELLEPGEILEVSVSVPGLGEGNFESWALVDSLGTLAEGEFGENNNVFGPAAISIGGGASNGPDLSISYLQAYVQESQGQVLYIVDVTNTGNAPASAFTVGVFSDLPFPPGPSDTPDEVAAVPSLAPGATAPLSIAIRSTPQSFWQSYVLADVDDDIQEPNEGNNLGSASVFP